MVPKVLYASISTVVQLLNSGVTALWRTGTSTGRHERWLWPVKVIPWSSHYWVGTSDWCMNTSVAIFSYPWERMWTRNWTLRCSTSWPVAGTLLVEVKAKIGPLNQACSKGIDWERFFFSIIIEKSKVRLLMMLSCTVENKLTCCLPFWDCDWKY